MTSACCCAAAAFVPFFAGLSASATSCSACSAGTILRRLFFCGWKPSGATAGAAAAAKAEANGFFFAELAGVLVLRTRFDEEGLANLSKLEGAGPLRGVVGAAAAAAEEAGASGANELLLRLPAEPAAALDLAAALAGGAEDEAAALAEDCAFSASNVT